MIFSLFTGLVLVLFLLGLSMRALRHFVQGYGTRGGRLPMEVLQRMALSQKQGIAIVRVGERILAVSMGEGGVRTLAELDEEEIPETMSAPARASAATAFPELMRLPFGVLPAMSRLCTRIRSAGARFAAVLMIAGAATIAPGGAHAQAVVPQAVEVAEAQTTGADTGAGTAVVSRLAPRMDLRLGDPEQGGLRLSGTVGIVVMMGLLTLLPTLLLMMTSFTRILIVLTFLKQALGTQSAPPAPLMASLALLLTGFVMAPTFSEANQRAFQPWLDGQIEQEQMLENAVVPFRHFMLSQTRESDLVTFMEMSRSEPVASVEDVPLVVLMSAFVTSELKTAFQLGFMLFLPFIVIDLVVASVLMSMGMFMLPPAMIALPFKLLLFVLVDGWSLMVQSLVSSFY